MQPFNPLCSASGRGSPDTRLKLVQQLSTVDDEFTHRDMNIELSDQQIRNVFSDAEDEGLLEVVYEDDYEKPGALTWYRVTDAGESAIVDGLAAFFESLVTAIMQSEWISDPEARDKARDAFIDMFDESMVQSVRTRDVDRDEIDWRRAERLYEHLS